MASRTTSATALTASVPIAPHLATWLREATRRIPPADAAAIAFPPWFVGKLLAYAVGLHRTDDQPWGLESRDPEFVAFVLDGVRAAARHWFRWEVSGLDYLPAEGPALLVGNHNGGLVTTEAYLTLLAIWDRFGPGRRLYTLAHDFVCSDPTVSKYAAKLGILRAGHDAAHEALRRGHLVLVYPGSDIDTFRPWHDRNRIVLAGRTGFVKLALRERVPIIPVVTSGTHEQLVVLASGRALARTLHLKRWARTEVLPLVWALPWGLAPGFVPYLPLPAQTTVRFGSPMTWPDLATGSASEPTTVNSVYADVEDRMQRMLDGLSVGRIPFFGTLGRRARPAMRGLEGGADVARRA